MKRRLPIAHSYERATGVARVLRGWVSALVLSGVALAMLLATPLVVSPYLVVLITSILMYVILAVSWTAFCAPSQYFSLGIAAFFGTGIYTLAVAWAAYPRASLPLVLVVAGAASAVLAVLVGLTTLRIKGMYFAIFTFGLSELLRYSVMWWEVNITGTVGRWVPIIEDVVVFRYMSGLAIITILAAYLLRRSRYGLALRSVGDAELAAEHVGVDVTAVKVAVFAASCFFTGAAGALIATRWTYIDADFAFDPIRNTFTIMMALFGGMDVLIGPVIGAVSIGVISDVVLARLPQVNRLLLGLMLVIVVVFIPQGLAGLPSIKPSLGRLLRMRRRDEPDPLSLPRE